MKGLRPTLLIVILAVGCGLSAQILGDPIYNFDFADGIPGDWENASSSGISHWEYRGPGTTPDNTVCSQGSCSAGSVPIASLTQDNGFVIFDSNYWDDDDDVCGGLGTGQDPAPHTAWLTTSTLDFTGYTTLVLTFQQQFKHYITSTKVQVSNDNGATWNDVLTNSGVFSPAAEWKTVNITSLAANQNDVKIRFLFSGTYYWWLLDDIVVYSPNPNDLLLSEPKYTWFGVTGQVLDYMEELPYDQYPTAMIPAFHFTGKGTNIGGNTQTQCNLNVQVKKGTTSYYNSSSPNATITAGSTNLMQLATAFTSPATVGDYIIAYNLDQLQTDDNTANNIDTLDYSISPYAYARDEGPMEDVFVPGALYQNQVSQVGNVFQSRSNTVQCQSLGVALGEGTAVGSSVYGIIYKHDLQTVLATTNDYVVNAADINTVGEEKIVTLYFDTPLTLQLDSMYVAMVSNVDGSLPLRVARSGTAITEASFVKYPSSNGLFYLLKTPVVRMNIYAPSAMGGCTNDSAVNYNPAATIDDGSCDFAGCTDPNADNYDPSANWDDGSCALFGCTNPAADNYDPAATSDDGTCIVSGCTNALADNYNADANNDDGSCIISGCTDPEAANFFPEANNDNGTCIYPGCTDPAADNYDAGANNDDGSCIYFGCTNAIADNYDPQANVDDGSCIISGCTDAEADNYYSEANYDDGSCYYLGCTDPSADNYDITATVEDGSCLYYGCTDMLANNFESGANFDDGSCVYSYAIFSLNTDSACAPVTIVVNNQTDVAPGSQCLLNDGNGNEYDTCADEYVLEYDIPGTYYITLQYIQSTESTTFIDSIIVYPPAGAPVLTYFEGPPAYLATSNDDAGTYQWWLDDVQIAVSDTSSLEIDNGGIVDNGYYQVHYTDIHGCDAWSDTLLVLQPQFYVVEDSLCAIASFEFIDQTDQVEGALCEILLNEGMLCIPGSNIITVDEPGNYEVGIQYMVGEEIFGPVYSDVVVLPTPEVPTLIADGNAMALLCEGCSGNTIQWYNSDSVLVQTGDTLLVTGNYPETFYVVITNVWGCSSSSETTTFPLSVSEPLQTNHLAVFPNPTSDFTMLTAAHAPGTINMYDATGALVLSMYAPGNRTPIDLSRLAPGLYQLYAGGCRIAVVVE